MRRFPLAKRVLLGTCLLTSVAAGGTPATQPSAFGDQPDGGSIFDWNERDAETIRKARSELPADVQVTLPADRLKRLPKTVAALREGRPLRIVMVGDSIINDTARSAWHELLQQRYPKTAITRIVSVKGGAGAQWFQEGDRLQRYVLDWKPDLVIFGGISHNFKIEPVRDCVHRVRQNSDADVWIMTGPYGKGVDPLAGPDWRAALGGGQDETYAAQLRELADQAKAEFLDLQLVWGEFLRKAGKPVDHYLRDPVHANPIGEAVLARILDQYFSQPLPQAAEASRNSSAPG